MKAFRKIIRHPVSIIVLGTVLLIAALITERLGADIAAWVLYILALVGAGHRVFVDAVRGILRRDPFDEKLLMSIASIGAMIIGERTESIAVMLFFLVGEYFEQVAVRRSRASLRSLMDIRPDTARVLRDGEPSVIDAEDVEIGEQILILAGERVPLDARIVSGEAELDTSALTGESVPRAIGVGDEISSGTVVIGGAVYAEVTHDLDSSAASRILELVEEASERKSREESFITSFARVYTPIVTLLALLMALLPPIFKLLTWQDSIYRALSFLVVSCPCALVISVPMAFFGGIGGAASGGILYKGGNTFAPISRVSRVVFDKTGTLTTGEFTVSEVLPSGVSSERLIRLAASVEKYSNHPIARGIVAVSEGQLAVSEVRELAGGGIVADVEGSSVAVGNLRLMAELSVEVPEEARGYGRVYVSENGSYIGAISLKDTVRPEAAQAIARLRELGVKRTYILSGDNLESVRAVGDALGIDEVYGELMPEGKYERLEELLSGEGSLVYVGDGINDAPCLARADVGIAMGACGSDSAIEAADAAIMSDDLSRIADTVLIARRTLAIAKQNIVFALGIKLAVLVLAALNLAGMWLAVFADVGVAVLAILNAMRALRAPRRK